MPFPFSPPSGLNSDDTTFVAEGRWVRGNNVRFYGGRPQTVGGWASQFLLPSNTYGIVRSILPFARSGGIVVAYGTIDDSGSGSRLLVGGGVGNGLGLAAPADRTPTGVSGSTLSWSLDSWGDVLLACPLGGTLYEQSGVAAATEVATAPDRIDGGILVTNERQVLALGCNEESSGTFNPMCIRGCDLEDYGDWTTSPDSNAFEHILPGSGKIVGGRRAGGSIAVWTEAALYLGQFVGNPDQTYRFDLVDGNCGLIGPDAVTTLGQRFYWLGTDLRIRTWVPGELPQIIPCPIGREFAVNVALNFGSSRESRFVAHSVSKFEEVWFHYRDNRGGQPSGAFNNRYIAFCAGESRAAQRPVWFTGLAGRTAAVDSGIVVSLTYATEASTIISAVPGAVYLEETGTAGTANSPHFSSIESGDQYIDNGQRRMMVRGVRPDFENITAEDGEGVAMTLYVRDHPISSSTGKGPFLLTSGMAKKDFRASGKIISVKFEMTDAAFQALPSGCFRLGKPVFDIIPLGER